MVVPPIEPAFPTDVPPLQYTNLVLSTWQPIPPFYSLPLDPPAIAPKDSISIWGGLRQVQSKAWVVIRLCTTNEDSILQYYQKLDDQLELSLEVLDDYLDEAKEVYGYNPWLTYSLCLHRCREIGMSSHGLYRWLDWLDERSLTKAEIYQVVQQLGLAEATNNHLYLAQPDEWLKFCNLLERQQQAL
jgi:hypothetical protein